VCAGVGGVAVIGAGYAVVRKLKMRRLEKMEGSKGTTIISAEEGKGTILSG